MILHLHQRPAATSAQSAGALFCAMATGRPRRARRPTERAHTFPPARGWGAAKGGLRQRPRTRVRRPRSESHRVPDPRVTLGLSLAVPTHSSVNGRVTGALSCQFVVKSNWDHVLKTQSTRSVSCEWAPTTRTASNGTGRLPSASVETATFNAR